GPSGAPRAGPHDWMPPGRGRRDSARRPGSSRERPRGGTGPRVELKPPQTRWPRGAGDRATATVAAGAAASPPAGGAGAGAPPAAEAATTPEAGGGAGGPPAAGGPVGGR